jgi:subtilisin family serine protease
VRSATTGCALRWRATDLPDVVNNSYGEFPARCDPLLWDAVRALRRLEIIPVAASGNSGVAEIPGALPEAMPVGALNRQNEVPSWSGRGPSPCYPYTYPDFSAPGTRVRSAWLGGTRRVLTGTSMAAPHVAGVVALLRGRNPNLTVAQIENTLMQTARDLGPPGPDNTYGFGLPDAYRAMLCLNSGAYLCPGTCP